MSTEILIIDDNADIRNIINDLIVDAGYKTRIAANYNQALNEIDKKLPDVAIIDVKLDKGDNDGLELLSHIKSKNSDIPVIIITGHANIGSVQPYIKNTYTSANNALTARTNHVKSISNADTESDTL